MYGNAWLVVYVICKKKKYDEELDQFVLGNLSLKTPNL